MCNGCNRFEFLSVTAESLGRVSVQRLCNRCNSFTPPYIIYLFIIYIYIYIYSISKLITKYLVFNKLSKYRKMRYTVTEYASALLSQALQMCNRL